MAPRKRGRGEGQGAGAGAVSEGCEVEPPEGAMVLMCAGCRGIVGDTSAFVALHHGLKGIALSSASDVEVMRRKPETSTRGVDAGSSFLVVRCSNCQASVGRVYVSTPRHLDPLRNCFTFLSGEGVTSYALGSGEVRLEGGGGEGGSDLHVGPPTGGASNPAQSTAALDTRLEALEGAQLKVQNLLLLYNERLEALENRAGPQALAS